MSSPPATEVRYRAVFERHYEQVYTYFRRRLDVEGARDCTAETFVVAWRRVGEGLQEKVTFAGNETGLTYLEGRILDPHGG